MSTNEIAAKLNNAEYPLRIDKELVAAAKAAGIVIVYGASDDLMELEGAINDEVGACNGGTAIIDQKGVLPDWEQLMDDSPTKDEVREYFEREKQSAAIEAIWDSEGYSFTYKTSIPHVTFDVVEDGEKYCRGIVLSLSDIPTRDRDTDA
jgi:hypothetical protein